MTEKSKRGWNRLKNATMRGCTIAVAVLLAFFRRSLITVALAAVAGVLSTEGIIALLTMLS